MKKNLGVKGTICPPPLLLEGLREYKTTLLHFLINIWFIRGGEGANSSLKRILDICTLFFSPKRDKEYRLFFFPFLCFLQRYIILPVFFLVSLVFSKQKRNRKGGGNGLLTFYIQKIGINDFIPLSFISNNEVRRQGCTL